MISTRGTCAGSDDFDALMRHPYGVHLWGVMDRGLHLLSTLLYREFADDPAMCRLAAAETVHMTNESWAGDHGLFPEEVIAWACRFRQHSYNCWCESAVCGLRLDDRAAFAIRGVAETVGYSVKWLNDEALARRYALAGIGIGMVAAARATDGRTPSRVPPDMKRWALDQYDSYLP